jgi:hypothetical protein
MATTSPIATLRARLTQSAHQRLVDAFITMRQDQTIDPGEYSARLRELLDILLAETRSAAS